MRDLRILLISSLVWGIAAAAVAQTPVVGGPCEGCELVFEGMPDLVPGAVGRIAPEGTEGEPMILEGTVRTPDGDPAAGVVVYAYHTDVRGIYPDAGTRHGALRAWALTGEDGRYRFETIRPGGYPGSGAPQHIHMHVIEPDRATYWIDDVLFTDDPRLGDPDRHVRGRGGRGIVTPTRGDDGVWLARRDIVLGEGIPGYPSSSR